MDSSNFCYRMTSLECHKSLAQVEVVAAFLIIFEAPMNILDDIKVAISMFVKWSYRGFCNQVEC